LLKIYCFFDVTLWRLDAIHVLLNPEGDGSTVSRNIRNYVLIDRQNILNKTVPLFLKPTQMMMMMMMMMIVSDTI